MVLCNAILLYCIVFYAMLYYQLIVQNYVVLYNATLCYTTLCFMQCYATLCGAIQCDIMWCYTMQHYVVLCKEGDGGMCKMSDYDHRESVSLDTWLSKPDTLYHCQCQQVAPNGATHPRFGFCPVAMAACFAGLRFVVDSSG